VHFIDIRQNTPITDYVVGDVMDVVHRHVVTDIAGDDAAVGDTHRQGKIVMFEYRVFNGTDTDESEKEVVQNLVGIKGVTDVNGRPVTGSVSVLYKSFDFITSERTPRP
jgi:hypothetical protein